MAPIPTETSSTISAIANLDTKSSAPAPKDVDTSELDATTPTSSNTKKRKRKDNAQEKQVHILHQSTFRKTAWSYFHLILLTPGTASTPPATASTDSTTTTTSLSPLLASSLLTHSLRSYLGIAGTAIPIDMLKISGRSVWVRIPRQDARAFRASLSGWVGTCDGEDIPGVEGGMGVKVGVAWRVVGEGGVLGGITTGGDGMDLFG
ncbi:unnamed protein product [Alternaria sp. RS040]